LEALEFEGVGLDEVKQVPMDVDRIPEAFRKGDLEAFSSWEPVASRGLRLRTGAEIIQSSRFLGFTFFRKDFADQNREAVDQILAAEVRAVKWMAASKANQIQSCRWTIQDSAELVPSGFESSAEDLANIIVKLYKRNFLPIIPENDLQDGGHLHREFLFLHGLNLIDKRFVWESMRQVFDRKMILHIIAKPGTYRLAEFNYLPGVNP
jgi:hypothetical protein